MQPHHRLALRIVGSNIFEVGNTFYINIGKVNFVYALLFGASQHVIKIFLKLIQINMAVGVYHLLCICSCKSSFSDGGRYLKRVAFYEPEQMKDLSKLAKWNIGMK